MPFYCVAANCTNKASLKDGISLHTIPFFNDERAEAKRRRKLWVDFVSSKRVFVPSKTSTICSDHFTPEDYERRFFSLPGLRKPNYPKLRTDELGVCVYPTIHASSSKEVEVNQTQSTRSKRLIIRNLLDKDETDNTSLISQPVEKSGTKPRRTNHQPTLSQEVGISVNETCCDEILSHPDTNAKQIEECPERDENKNSQEIQDGMSEDNVLHLLEKNRRLRNKVISLQASQKKKGRELRNIKRRVSHLEELLQQNKCEGRSEIIYQDSDDNMKSDDDDKEQEESEMDQAYAMETDEISDSEDEDDLEDEPEAQLPAIDGNIRTEPKFIVFWTQLLLLFQFCHSCKSDNPLIKTRQVGTKIVVTTTCSNPTCKQKVSTWHSQPNMPNMGISAGNFLLSMAILLAGGSITKVQQVFQHMGLSCICLRTYFRYQRKLLFPSVHLHWKKYQKTLLQKAKDIKNGIVVSGDGRHDSMGHSAKFCAYTIFCCTFAQIIHFDLVQRNQAGSSPAMEFMCFKLCMDFLIGYGICITTFISDRHTSIAKYMKTKMKNIIHYFDIWHLKKKIRKVLSKIAKEKEFEALNEWIKPCANHLHWSATSTYDGNGLVIWAKFKSFLRHMINKHFDHSDPLFNQCAHGANIEHRRWLTEGSPLHEKVSTALTNSRLVKGIQQASPLDQTSCLEGFHSVLNHFAPKMIAYSYVGQYCRHILAIMHFNLNLQRELDMRKADNQEKMKISYPKFKNGEATVRNVRIKPNFGYVQEIFDTFLKATKKNLEDAAAELKKKSPEPMNSMLQKQTKAQAMAKHKDRKNMVTQDFPPTTPVSEVQRQQASGRRPENSEKAKPHCKACNHPMKGHKYVTDCPRNSGQ